MADQHTLLPWSRYERYWKF